MVASRGQADGPDTTSTSQLHVDTLQYVLRVRLERSRGFRGKEINRVRELVEEYREPLLEGWNEFFGN